MGLAPLIVEELYEIVAQIAESGVSILVVEQFARTVLGVADLAAIMLHGQVTAIGQPDDIAPELEAAYLGAAAGPRTSQLRVASPKVAAMLPMIDDIDGSLGGAPSDRSSQRHRVLGADLDAGAERAALHTVARLVNAVRRVTPSIRA